MSDNKIALFDMDGTLFDFSGQMLDDLLELTPKICHDYLVSLNGNFHQSNETWLNNLMDLIKVRPGWWLNLPQHQPGWEIYEVIKDIGFECKILTKGPRSKPEAWAEKVRCVWLNFGGPENSPEIDIVSKNKHGVYGRILVEDHIPYLEPWLENRPRGLGILIDQPYNRGWEHPNMIRYTGDNLEEVKKRVKIAYDR